MLLCIGAALGQSGEEDKNPSAAVVADAPAKADGTDQPDAELAEGDVEESATPEPVPPALPNPDGEYDMICDYELGDFGDSGNPEAGYRFVAGGSLENTGNVAIKAQVTFKWRLLGQGWYTERKTYKVPYNRSRDVDITIPVDSGMIDAHQSAEADCRTNVKIVDTYGEVHD